MEILTAAAGESTGSARRSRDASRRIAPIRQMLGLTLLVLLLSSWSSVCGCPEQAPVANEYEVKAAFLYNFAKFVEWPSESFSNGASSLVVGLIGNDPFGAALDGTISGKTINGRPLAIRRLKWGQDLKSCHVLFVSSSEQHRLLQIIESVKGASVLTVSELDQFTQQGGIINFVMEGSKVRFEINTLASDQARLKISSKLLSLARVVRSGKGTGKN